jgi:hypothetical protein
MIKSSIELSLIFSGEHSIRHYKNDTQRAFLKKHLIKDLAAMTSLLNIGKNLNERQINTITEVLIDEQAFQILTPSEFKEAFFRGVKGNYGRSYDSVDIQKVYEWVNCYIEERYTAIEVFRQKEAGQRRQEAKKPLTALANLKFEKPNTAATKKAIPRSRSKGELEMDGYFNEFQKLYSEQVDKHNAAIRFVTYKGQVYDATSYCNIRWNETHE